MFRLFGLGTTQHTTTSPDHLIALRDIVKTYQTEAGDFQALKGIDLTIERGEFVGVIGKSGSGKSTLINMLTGIDRPTSGEVYVGGTPLHRLSEAELARWRGRNMGIVFQFFQLLPTLTVIENIMLPMDFCNMYRPRQRRTRAMALLDLVGVTEQAHKLPAMISGGQQQRVAIARALANDPPLIIADEPTGNLDSHTSEQVFDLFAQLVAEGKTFVMVTHDDDQARRMQRTVVIADGEIVNEWLARALPMLSQELLVEATHHLSHALYAPGQPIIRQGDDPDYFYIIASGRVNVFLEHPDGSSIYVDTLKPGQYFGEIALMRGGRRTATVRAADDGEVDVLALDRAVFRHLLERSDIVEAALQNAVTLRREQAEQALVG